MNRIHPLRAGTLPWARASIAATLVACSAAVFAAGAAPAPTGASAPHAQAAVAKHKARKAAAPKKLVDVNRASKKELKTLPGIGDAEADRIIAGRPYLTKAHLATTNAVPAGTYFSIRRLIIVGPPTKAAGKS